MGETIQEIVRVVYDENQKFRKAISDEQESRFSQFLQTVKAARPGGGGDRESFASRFVGSAEYKAYLTTAAKADFPQFTYKAVGPIVLGHVPNSLAPPVAVGPALLPQYPSRLREIVPSTEVSSEYIIAVREQGSEGSAGIQVNEGDTKPQIDMKFVPANIELHTFAGWTKVSTQSLEDVGWMAQTINNNIVRKIQQAEDKQFVADLLAAATAWAGGVAGNTAIDQIAMAQTSLEVLGWTVSGTLLNPADLAALRRLKTSTGEYLQTPLWIGPIVASPEIPAGTFLTGAFRDGARILDRDSTIKIATGWVNDDFVKNLRVVLGEQRSYIWIPMPAAFAKGSLAAPPAAMAAETESARKSR